MSENKKKVNNELKSDDIKNSSKKSSTKSTAKSSKKSTVNLEGKTSSKKNSSVKKSNVTKKNTSGENVVNDDLTLLEADSFYHVSLLAQAVCVVGILAISVLAIFENSFTIPIEVLVGITLLIMAYNNLKLFKRKGLTIIYIIFGLISFIIGILGYFGVTI